MMTMITLMFLGNTSIKESIQGFISLILLVVFIVGMFSPKKVGCSSRGKVALIYLGLLFLTAGIISGNLGDAIYCISLLSLLAFIIGLFNPKAVWCSSRAAVASIYIGVFFLSVFLGCQAHLSEIGEWNPEIKEIRSESPQSEKTEMKKEKEKEIPVLEIGSAWSFTSEGGTVQITFTNIKAQRTPKNTLNLVFTLFVENDSGKEFSKYDAKWKLLDSRGVELDDTEVYDPSSFLEYDISMILVDPYSEELERIGYNVKEGATYYLSMGGKVIGKVPVEMYMDESIDEVDY